MDDKLLSALKHTFNYTCFRPLQLNIMQDMILNNDMLVLMPTGAGKSICYQLPAIVQGGLTIVISPLISLIYDQIADLKKHGVLAHYWCTGAPVGLREIFTDINEDKCNLFYTTPESFNTNEELRRLLHSVAIRRFIIDEAHCLSNWGHDFRSSYLKLDIRDEFPEVPICGFTATATKLVCADITERLHLKDPLMWMTSYVKPNISYNVSCKTDDSWRYITGEVAKFIRTGGYTEQTGIIYCLSRKQCEILSASLTKFNLSAGYYHASMPPDKKTETQQAWLDGKLKIIVATIAFALGINKPDVRYVIHTSMPNSIEGYYQQAGRAGRDGKPSVAMMFYSSTDKDALENMINYEQQSKEAPVTPLHRISQMYRLCINRDDCFKVQLANYLGEYSVKTCTHRKDTSPCGPCKRGATGSAPPSSAIEKALSLITGYVNIKHVQMSLKDHRALNYLLNTEQVQTVVVGEAGNWSEMIFKTDP